MSLRKYKINWPLAAVIAFIVAILFVWESNNLKIETDILESMPKGDPVLSDARRIIKYLPVQDRLLIDINRESANKDELARVASVVTEKLRASGLFTKVGITDEAQYFSDLMAHVSDNLPLLFNAERLEKEVQPLLESSRVKEAFAQNRQSLEQLEGIGRSAIMTKDPLGFSGIIFREMSALLPAGKAQFYQGQLIAEDGKHALIIARIAGSGTDTATGARIAAFLNDIEKGLPSVEGLKGDKYLLHSAGAYRAALDNETAAKRDTRIAIILTILGIAILLLLAFPRPLIGLLALLPFTVGAIAALFVCSFFFKSISLLAVGFGGAIMAFTVDLGVTYLLFLDQPQQTYGRQVARELWSAELLAVLSRSGKINSTSCFHWKTQQVSRLKIKARRCRFTIDTRSTSTRPSPRFFWQRNSCFPNRGESAASLSKICFRKAPRTKALRFVC
jgi:predicted exporter